MQIESKFKMVGWSLIELNACVNIFYSVGVWSLNFFFDLCSSRLFLNSSFL